MTGPGPGFAPAPSPNGPPGGPPRGMTGSRSSAPPPLPGHMAYGGGAMPPLSVIFNGQKIPIGKPEFVIGRGSKPRTSRSKTETFRVATPRWSSRTARSS